MEEGPDEPDEKPGAKKNKLKSLWFRYRKFQLTLTPQQNLFFGFLVYLVSGWLLLCLPFVQKLHVAPVDNLFMASSALSTTGLVTVSVSDSYNLLGQLIILFLIQVGGIGYMTFSSFIVLSRKSNLTHWHQRVLNAEFSMPRGFELKDFLKSVVVFTIGIEIIGALCFFISFKSYGIPTGFAIWSSIFHSISSFCTAGFGLYNNSFESFASDGFINFIISFLSILGSFGFIVVTDVWNRIRGKTKSITYTSKIIFLVFGILLGTGTLIIFCFEPSVNHLPGREKFYAAFFQSMTALTTVGFNTVPLGHLSLTVLLMILFLMYIGASPSGTGGGLKSTTLTALAAVLWSRIRGKKKVSFLGHIIPPERASVAVSTFIFYTGLIYLTAFLLSVSETFPFEKILFETASAIGTVGLSTGITGDLSLFGKCCLICVMFIGRLGVITFGLAILAKKSHNDHLKQDGDLAV